MTCIVGVAGSGHVILGGDSAGVSGWDLTVRADSKVFTVGEYVMGFTTSFRMGQLLRYSFDPPTPDGWDVDRFMATRFINDVRTCLRDGGWLGRDKEQRDEGGTFLVGVRGLLYAIYSDFQIGRSANGYAAIGCGAPYALGSLHSSRHGADPNTRARRALEAAAANSAGVAAPFAYVRTA